MEEAAARYGRVLELYPAWSPDHHASAALDRIAARLADLCAERYGPTVRPRAGT